MRYIVNDPDTGAELYETETAARHAFDRVVERLREEAAGEDTWHEDAESAFWGEVIPRQRLRLRVTARAEDDTEEGEWCRKAGWDLLAEGVVEDVPAADPTAAPAPAPERTKPVTLTRRSPEARDAYHEGYAAAMEHMAVALRELAGGAADSAALNRTLAAFDTPAPDPTADRAQVRALGER